MLFPPLRSLSIRARIICVSAGTVLLLGVVTTLFVRRAFERPLHDQLEHHGTVIARNLAANAVAAVLTEHYLELELMFRESKRGGPEIEYIFLLSPSGAVLAHTFEGGFPAALKDGGPGPAVRRLATARGIILDFSAPLLGGAAGVLRLGLSESAVRREVDDAVRVILVISTISTLAAAGLAVVLALAIVEPLEHLAAAADTMRAGQYPDPVAIDAAGEIGRLATAFNAMVVGRRIAAEEQARLIAELQEALANVRLLQGMLPICASCKRIRDDTGYWNQIESYISTHTDVKFSHGLCPECLTREYPEYADKIGKERRPQGRTGSGDEP